MQSQVLCGDCYDILPKIPSGVVSLAFVDPPYNFGIDYGPGKSADRLPPEEYVYRMESLIRQCVRCLTKTGCLWFLCPERWADDIGSVLSGILPRRNRIIWRETFGQYRESSFPSGHRHLFYHVKELKLSPFHTEAIRIPSQRMMAGDKRSAGPRVPDDVWEIPRLVGNAAERISGHPCQLPETLLERIILCASKPGDLVLDPNAGTGTTLRVAQRLGRRYLGIEKEERFVKVINDRLNTPFQQGLF